MKLQLLHSNVFYLGEKAFYKSNNSLEPCWRAADHSSVFRNMDLFTIWFPDNRLPEGKLDTDILANLSLHSE